MSQCACARVGHGGKGTRRRYISGLCWSGAGSGAALRARRRRADAGRAVGGRRPPCQARHPCALGRCRYCQRRRTRLGHPMRVLHPHRPRVDRRGRRFVPTPRVATVADRRACAGNFISSRNGPFGLLCSQAVRPREVLRPEPSRAAGAGAAHRRSVPKPSQETVCRRGLSAATARCAGRMCFPAATAATRRRCLKSHSQRRRRQPQCTWPGHAPTMPCARLCDMHAPVCAAAAVP